MKVNVRMGFKPAVILGLVSVKIIKHHVELFSRILSDELVHEVQKFAPASTPVMAGMYQAGGNLQSSKKRGGAVALVFVTKACQRPGFPLSPLSAKSTTFARCARRCSLLLLRVQDNRVSLSFVESRISGAGRAI